LPHGFAELFAIRGATGEHTGHADGEDQSVSPRNASHLHRMHDRERPELMKTALVDFDF
jgi:hypothetical protein